jgi:hypothetical protein
MDHVMIGAREKEEDIREVATYASKPSSRAENPMYNSAGLISKEKSQKEAPKLKLHYLMQLLRMRLQTYLHGLHTGNNLQIVTYSEHVDMI